MHVPTVTLTDVADMVGVSRERMKLSVRVSEDEIRCGACLHTSRWVRSPDGRSLLCPYCATERALRGRSVEAAGDRGG